MELTDLLNKIQEWCEDLQKECQRKWPDCKSNWHLFKYKLNPKMIKIIRCSFEGKEQSVYCFVDYDGNIYKAASWNRPADGIRTDIDHVDHQDIYGGSLYNIYI